MPDDPSTDELARRLAAAEAALAQARAGEAAARASAERYRALFQGMGQGYCELELVRDGTGRALDQRYLAFNPAFERLFGISVAYAVGRTASEVFPDLEPWWNEAFDRIARCGKPERIEHQFAALSRWFEVFVYPHGSDRLTVTFEDVTERRRAEDALRGNEERQAFLLKLYDAMRLLSDPAEIQGAAARLLGELLGASRAYYLEFDARAGSGTVARDYVGDGVPSLVGRYDYETFRTVYARISDGSTWTVSNVAEEGDLADEERDLLIAQGVVAWIDVPLVKHGGLVAILCVVQGVARRWTSEEVALVEEIAERTWAAVERARTEVALRESEGRYRELFERIDEGFCIIEMIFEGDTAVDYRFIEVNPAFERHTGIANGKGRRMREIAPEHEEHWFKNYGDIALTGKAKRFEAPAKHLGDRWYDLNAFRVGKPEQRRVAVLFSDVTQRQRHAAALRASEERQAFLLKLGDALRAEPDADAVAERALGMLFDEMRLDRCYIASYRLADDRADITHQVGNDGVPSMPGMIRLSDFPAAFRQVFDRTLVIDDVAQTQGLSDTDRRNIDALGLRALVAPTLRRGENNPLWVLVAVSAHPRSWTASEIALIEEVAERTWTAIERAHAEATLRESEERQQFLLALSDALTPLTVPSEVAEVSAARLCEHLGVSRVYYGEIAGVLLKVEQDYARSVPSLVGEHSLEPFGRDFLAAYRPGAVIVVDEVERDPRLTPAARAQLLDFRVAAFADAVLFEENGAVSLLAVQSAVPRAWSAPELSLIREVAERVRSAVKRARAEVGLRESEERFQQFAEASASALWIRNAGSLEMEYVSPAIETIYGIGPEAVLGDVKRWAAMVVPEDRQTALDHLHAAGTGTSASHEFRIRRASDGAFRWIRDTDFPLRGNGHVQRIGGIAEDVTDSKLAVEHQGVLLAELQHRVRNIMAMIRATARRTAGGASSVDDYQSLLNGRLLALARVQVLLTRKANAGGSLQGVLESEIGAQAHGAGQYELTGPDIMLSPKMVEVLTLAFHELSTNALKYGALSVEGGRVVVRWSVREKRGGPNLVLDWIEEGAPLREPPRRRGFGSELIERRIPYELKGSGKLSFEPEGLRCHLELPLHDGESILETDGPVATTVFGGSLDMTGAPDLSGRSILVVEDDYYAAVDTAAALQSAGARVLGPCPSEAATLQLLETQAPDAAVLDLNLGSGGPRFEIARLLKARGIPFLFLTGYDAEIIPEDMAGITRLQKPLPLRNVVEAVGQL